VVVVKVPLVHPISRLEHPRNPAVLSLAPRMTFASTVRWAGQCARTQMNDLIVPLP
jgi:hypothetical protein